jgi:uncharacterized protein (TIGR02145 family)
MKKVIFLLAVSFSLVFAYTAADVYGAWNTSGKLTGEKMFIKRLADGTEDIELREVFDGNIFLFEKDNLGSFWRWRNGRIEFPNTYMWCELISNKEMDCHDGQGYKKETYKKAGTVAQYKQTVKRLEQEIAKAKKKKEQEEEKERKQKELEYKRWAADTVARAREAEERARQREKEVQDSLAKEAAKESAEIVLIKKGLTDSRDGKNYKVVKIGNQMWMAENLNYETEGSKCYDNQIANCTKYGRLYGSNSEFCPEGWHLPSNGEWETLMTTIGGKYTIDGYTNGNKLKTKSGWNKGGNGTDDFGFSALPGGFFRNEMGKLEPFGVGEYGYWWSETSLSIGASFPSPYAWSIDGLFIKSFLAEGLYCSIRCVKD